MSSPVGTDPRLRTGPDGVVYALGRLAGHPNFGHGQAYLAHDCTQDRCATNIGGTVHQANGAADSVIGNGHAVCGCGVLSPHAHTGAARRRWHRQHKARRILGCPEPAGQPTPVDANGIA